MSHDGGPLFVRQLFDATTSTYTYLVADPETRRAVIIDPVRERAARDLQLVEELGFTLEGVLETHVHADHVTGAGALRDKTGAKTYVSKHGGAPCADVLVDDGDAVPVGGRTLAVRATPGHTAGCVTYVTDDERAAFTGDALFIRGCGRTDFQGGDAGQLWRSVHEKIFTLPDDTVVFPGHDYQGRTASTVGEEKRFNPRLNVAIDEPAFRRIMGELRLDPPKLIDVAVPANQRCGQPPA